MNNEGPEGVQGGIKDVGDQDSSAANKTCPNCGSTLSAKQTLGLCPACLLREGIETPKVDSHGETIAVTSDQRDSESETDSDLPTHLGEYLIVDEVARGGMGVIYRAHQTSLNRTVALKMILEGHLASDRVVKRFRAEAEAVANLRHPSIVPIYDIGEHNKQHFFTMPFIDGEDLAHVVRNRQLTAQRSAEIVRGIADAVEHAHENHILHRDLKPANVLIDSSGQPHVTDFGLAKQLEEKDSQITGTGEILGTPSYMSPEQARGNRELTPRSDIYSIGALLYELLTGRPPFRGDSLGETLQLVMEADPPRPRLLNPSLPRDLETICLKCLQKKPAARYASAAQLAEDLRRFLDDRSIIARPELGFSRGWRSCRRNPWRVLAALATLTVIAAASAVYHDVRTERLLFESRVETERSHHEFIAEKMAEQFALELHALSENLLRVARSPQLSAILAQADCDTPALFELLQAAHQDSPPGMRLHFANWNAIDRDGKTLARSPNTENYRQNLHCQSVTHRDYFKFARPNAIHLSRLFESSVDRDPRFSVSVQILHEGEPVGVLAAMVTTTSTERLSGTGAKHRVLIVAPDDASERFLVFGDPRRVQDDSREFDPAHLKFQARANPNLPPLPRAGDQSKPLGAVDDHIGLDGARCVGGFAQIGNTDFTVIVESRFNALFPRYAR